MTDLILTLVAFAFLSAGTPGPNNLMLMTSGMNYGFRRSLGHITGVAYGFPLMIVAVGLGLTQLFALVPTLEIALKYVCAAYLVYLAYKIATARPKITEDGAMTVSGRPLTFTQAAAFQWVNPKAWVMATTALTVYALPLSNTANAFAVAAVFAFAGTFTATSWTALGDRLRLFFADPVRLRVFNTVAATLLLATLIPVFWPNLL
ncbi:MAG: LysE family translocator [Rhizobiales bacterium]|nr:LysE family translocator [Hyphomicrobiales bacterium]MBO6699405.1 LysE family translocator [Hyphomicrobiales bacterium]MBO6736943.1 LysE family translocator [Hyphomicrobiales bacterium]MBO6911983.1 LysE family translocator [Hyphomicrobiales bacterium]MBO6954649.1 LysE family translocator [Hyphomicrobiales bacterium]